MSSLVRLLIDGCATLCNFISIAYSYEDDRRGRRRAIVIESECSVSWIMYSHYEDFLNALSANPQLMYRYIRHEGA